MKTVYIYSKVFDSLPEPERREHIAALRLLVFERLRRRGTIVPHWDEDKAREQELSPDLREALDESLPHAIAEARQIVNGPLRFVQVDRAVREVKKQAVSLARHAPHFAYSLSQSPRNRGRRCNMSHLHSPPLYPSEMR